MFITKLKYTDFNDEEREETLYFHITKSQITEKQLSVDGGYDKMLERILEKKDVPAVAKLFKEFILDSYGIKSADGNEFKKSPEIREAFYNSAAYDALYDKLLTDGKFAGEFFKGIFPKDLQKALEENKDKIPALAGN